MIRPSPEMVETFLQLAGEHLQFLREYSGILQDPCPLYEDLERLYISAHDVAGTGGSYGYALFHEVAGKLAHVFHYAMNATIVPEATAPLVEFLYEAIAVLESDLILIGAKGVEAEEEIAAFKQRYPFAFQRAPCEGAGSAEACLEPQSAIAIDLVIDNVPELEPDEEIPAEILEFFVPEAEEHLQTVTDCLLALEANPNEEDIHCLFRAMHTLKGSAAQVGWQRIATLAHRAEDLVGRLRDGEWKPSAAIIDLCLEAVDMLKKLLYREWEDESAFQIAARTLIAKIEHIGLECEPGVCEDGVAPAAAQDSAALPMDCPEDEDGGESSSLLFDSVPSETVIPETPVVPALEPEAWTVPAVPVGMGQSRSVRIALERLDRMMNAVGELVINRTRMLGRLAELEKLAEVLNFSKGRMNAKVQDFQEKYEFSLLRPASPWPGFAMDRHGGGYGSSLGNGGLEYDSSRHGSFDATEFSELGMDRYDDFGILSRSLTEIAADISEVLKQLGGLVRRMDGDIDGFTKLAHRLQEEITQARMVPIGNLFTRIARTVRDAAKASNKQVELTLAGAETELDNNVIQQIADPLLHLLRNAVAHGIDPPEERYELGKSDRGNIAVRAYQRGSHICVEVEDDGRGVDFDEVKAAAVERGFLSAEEVGRMERRELLDLLFRPGFSTLARRTELAGRGVGLDVVKTNVANLNGEIEIETEKGIGTRFTLKVPLTLMISQALFVRCGEQTFAFPLALVGEIRRLRPHEIEEAEGKLTAWVRGAETVVVRLDEALQLPRMQPVNGYFHMVMVHVLDNLGGRQVGVVVEEVLRKDEIVVKNLGEYLRQVKLFPGATIAPDGSLILLVDLCRLILGDSAERRPLNTAMNEARLFAPGALS